MCLLVACLFGGMAWLVALLILVSWNSLEGPAHFGIFAGPIIGMPGAILCAWCPASAGNATLAKVAKCLCYPWALLIPLMLLIGLIERL
jgi:hypothetical protein